jgi:hypothetical protein
LEGLYGVVVVSGLVAYAKFKEQRVGRLWEGHLAELECYFLLICLVFFASESSPLPCPIDRQGLDLNRSYAPHLAGPSDRVSM